MSKQFTKKEKVQLALYVVSVILIIFGLLFMLTAAKLAPIFPAFYNIEHMIVQYIIVIITMAAGIMLFSNVAAVTDDRKLRNGMTIGITTFSTVLTLPLLYVFIALYPASNGQYGPVGEFMVKDIAQDFQAIFTTQGGQYAIYAAGIVLSIIFLAVPIFTAVLTVKELALKIDKNGIRIIPKDGQKDNESIASDSEGEPLAEAAADLTEE